MSQPTIESKIAAQLDASKQFLVVVIGLAMTNAIVEKLKYGLVGGIFVLRYPFESPDQIDHDPSKYTIYNGTNDTINCGELLVLGIFLIYALRFFFNNYTLLYQSYDSERIKSLSEEMKRKAARNSLVDLFLSIFTGVIVCLVSMTLTPSRFDFLLGFLIIHYVVDLAALGYNVSQIDRNEDKGKIFGKVVGWLVNNGIFIVVFVAILTLMAFGNLDPARVRSLILAFWLTNCIAALAITYKYRAVYAVPAPS